MMADAARWAAEESLLFGLVKQAISCRSVDNEAALDDPALDWEMIIEHAVEGGVAPMVYVFLADGRYHIPAAWMNRLHGFYVLAAAENMAYLSCAQVLFDVCEKEGLDLIALRGILFAQILYPDPALRPISDIDLLIRPEQMDRFAACLASLNYRRIPGHLHQWTNAQAIVDVHTDLIGGDRIAARRRAVDIDMDAVWTSSIPCAQIGGHVKMLAWEDEVLTCALHAVKHSCDRLLWFVDLARLADDRPEADWKRLIERARQFKLEKPAYYAFSYLQNTIGSSIQDEVLDALRPARPGWFERRCMARVLTGKPAGRFGELFTLFMMERMSDKWAFISETCFPERDVLEQAYGATEKAGVRVRLKRILHVAHMAFEVVKRSRKR